MTSPADTEELAPETPFGGASDLREELESLMHFKAQNVHKGVLTPCPACTTLVKIRANHCPNCESNIAANNALVREHLRRIDEIRAELDGDGARHGTIPKRTLGQRLKRLFSINAKDEEAASLEPDPIRRRLLDDVPQGDYFRILEHDGAWCRVRTRDGRTGWVFSTIVRDA